MSGAKRVARVNRRGEPLSSGADDVTPDLDIWDTSEVPSLGSSDLANGSRPPLSGQVSGSIPPPGKETLLGNAPAPGQPVQAASVAPPSSPPTATAHLASPSSIPASTLSELNGARTPLPRSVLVPGEQFGVYRIGACIGEGGMARIYQAEHAGLRRQVALKVLLDATTRVPEGRERFLREARIAAAIKHPNVVNIFDVGVHEDTAFLVMELLQGTDLEQLIATRGPLDEATIVDIMVPVVAGLSAVHDAGVVHRDLKPGNVFLAQGLYDEVDPKLLDFGICKAPGPEPLRLTANGMLIGTPFYMSPEGLRGEEMTPSSDQYSLGVVMYECATGTNPFHAASFAEIFRLIGAGEYPPPSNTRPQISKRLERIIMRAMSLDPAARFKDLKEMGRELLQLAGQRTRITWSLSFGEIERPKGSNTADWKAPRENPPPAAPPPSNADRRRQLTLFIPLLLLLAVLLFGIWTLFSAPPYPVQARPPLNVGVGSAATSAALGVPAVTPLPLVVGNASGGSLEVSPVSRGPSKPNATARVSSKPGHAVSWNRQRSNSTPRAEDAEPEWDIQPAPASTPIPNGQVKAGAQRTQSSGANGAPIFD